MRHFKLFIKYTKYCTFTLMGTDIINELIVF